MKPNNEVEIFSLKRDSTIWISNIDSLKEVITVQSKSHELLFLKIINKSAGEDSYYYDIVVIDRNTCEVYNSGFMLKTVAWKDLNDHTMVVYEECNISLYTKDGNLFVDRFCSKSKRYKEKQTFIFSETLHKFIEYSP
ncbi:hypothetical protein [Bernardetia litoralis]|nr:hypothetical protein [Bernardetia litoralis]